MPSNIAVRVPTTYATPVPARAHNRDRTGDLILTKDVLCQLSYVSDLRTANNDLIEPERETGLEPATSSLEGLRSTS